MLADNSGKEFEGAICRSFYIDIIISKIFGQSISFIVVGFNVILKYTIMYLVMYIGEDTQSAQNATTTRGIFIGQFINTGFVILLVNANLSEHFPKAITKHFRGSFYDYQPMWYIDVGLKIQLSMLIQMFMPVIGLVITYATPQIKQLYDNRMTGNPYVTRQTTMYWYKYFNSGSQYYIHFKYSDSLNITFVTLLYGLTIPMLFPIAAI